MIPDSNKQPFLRFAGLCERGPGRAFNEDALHVQTRSSVLCEGGETGDSEVELFSDPLCLGVADGCGGEGRENSIGRDILRYLADAVFSARWPIFEENFEAILQEANRRKNEEISRSSDRRALGAAIAAAFVDERRAMIVGVGNIRFYLRRRGELYRIVKDPSLVAICWFRAVKSRLKKLNAHVRLKTTR